MPCYNPLRVYRLPFGPDKGSVTLKRPWPPEDDKEGWNVFWVGCGKCVGCRLERARFWAVRCMLERKCHEVACFVTLTYDNEHMPHDGNLDKVALRNFWKRLREKLSPVRIRYFAAGEYGSKTYRPHYHAIIFGWSPLDLERIGRSSLGDYYYTSRILADVWQNGQVVVGECTYQSCGYVARYCLKGWSKENTMLGGRVRPFVVMSRSPGIGGKYYDDYKRSLAGNDTVVVDGRRSILPRFFVEKIKVDYPELYAILHDRRLRNALNRPSDSPERLAAREEYRKLKVAKLERGYDNAQL